ncbi:MAG: DUF4189 domain-containing protein [Hyphomicrobium sp.]|uniref:DUF4189 domain-containing protein n=1 Tax=Hyphomicrobium sp. TaxID=82 RepID=UPI003D0B752F
MILRAPIPLAILIVISAHAPQACADGAVAVGDDPNSFAWGIEVEHSVAPDVARTNALAGCRRRLEGVKVDPDLCAIVSEFRNQCVAAYMTSSGAGEGWALADTVEEARTEALAACRENAGENRTGCKESLALCDVTSSAKPRSGSGN